MRRLIINRLIAVALATSLCGYFALSAISPAYAYPPLCPTGQSQVFDTTCSLPGTGDGNDGGGVTGGNTDPHTPPSGKLRHYVEPPLGPCGAGGLGHLYAYYTTWYAGGPIVDPVSPDSVACREPIQTFGDVPTPTIDIAALKSRARLLVTKGQIATDFGPKFVTGAPIQFNAAIDPDLQGDLSLPGYHIWMEAHPTSLTWDFGDPLSGNSNHSGGLTATHTYETKNVNGENSAHSNVTVTFTVVWSGQLHVNQLQPGGGEEELQVDQLGTIPVESSIERPIVEVTPQLREP